jgi:hypothetical protein
MTKNLKLFSLFCLLWSTLFYSILQWVSLNQDARVIPEIVATIVYTIGFGVVGTYLGKGDSIRDVRFALSVWYGVIAVLIPVAVGAIWLVGWQAGDRVTPFVFAFFTVLALSTGYLLSRNKIKDMSKEELFR